MANQLTVLTVKHHNRLRFEKKDDYSFARNEHHCPLMASEVYHASFSFPIVFPADGDTIVPQAMLSAIPGTNNCVAEDGRWKGGYLPMHFRRYPFFLGREKNADQAVILFDPEAPQLSETEGKLLYNKRGDNYVASPLLNDIKNSLKNFDVEYQKTKALGKLLKNAGVLVPARMSIEVNGKKQNIAGFAIVDWSKVIKLEDSVLAHWARIGLVQLIHDHLQSLKRYGLLPPAGDKKTAADATANAPKKPEKKKAGSKKGKQSKKK